MKTQETPRTREFVGGVSSLSRIQNKEYRKVVHVNGETASLIFYTKDSKGKWIPWTGSKYYPCDPFELENLPSFIRRHLNLNLMQDYMESQAVGNFSKYPVGLYLENGQLVNDQV